MLSEKKKKVYIEEISGVYRKISENSGFIVSQKEIFIFYGFKK
jgi:hypothetical protein